MSHSETVIALCSRVHPEGHWTQPGEQITLSASEARLWVQWGWAERMPPAPEVAVPKAKVAAPAPDDAADD